MTPPTYPDATKVLSNNYTVDGTQFAIADEDDDALEPEDIWRHSRATEEHTHDDQRGLPVRRIDTVSAPTAAGHVTVTGDRLRWWGATSALALQAVTSGIDETVDGVKRFADPLLLPRQTEAPAAPGVGLGALYLGPNDRLYLRSGDNPPAPVGTPGMMVPALAWQTSQLAGEPVQGQVTLGGDPTWVLLYAAGQNQQAKLSTVAPFNYGQTPISCHVTWSSAPGTGFVAWTLLAKVVPPETLYADAVWATVASSSAAASGGASPTHKRLALTWTAGLPAPGDVVVFALKRDDALEVTAGGKLNADAYMVNAALVYG